MTALKNDQNGTSVLELLDGWLNRHVKALHFGLWLFCAAVGGLQAWAYRAAMVEDGISYLDIADAYLRGEWTAALNAYWSPLYSWLLAIPLGLFRPNAHNEAPLVHATIFVIYLGTMFCFDFFLRRVIAASDAKTHDGATVSFPRWAWLAVGYSLFLWSSLDLISLRMVTPDLCTAGFVYLAAGLTLNIATERSGWLSFAVLGVVLAMAYLTKAAMFICSIFFLAGLPFLCRGRNRALKPLLAIACFLLVGVPFVVALSKQKSRLTFGDAGIINYAWFVNRTTIWTHWQGDDSRTGSPKHPTRKLHDAPPLYEFAEPVGGTYPPTYDPSYWYEGLLVYSDWERQTTIILRGLNRYFEFFWERHSALPMTILALALLSGSAQFFRTLCQQWPLLVPGLGGLVLFTLVRAESRYCAGFFTLVIVACFAAARLRRTPLSRQVLAGLALAFSMTTCGMTGFTSFCLAGLEFFRPGTKTGDCGPSVAEEMAKKGLRPGDRVGIVGKGSEAYWARLAGVKIVAEIPKEHLESFWGADETSRSRLLELFGSAGARAVVSVGLPLYRLPQGWAELGSTDHYIHFIKKP